MSDKEVQVQVSGKWISRVSKIMMYVSVTMLFALLLLGTADVIGRYFLNQPIIGTMELGQILLAAMVLFGWPYAQQEEAHIKADIFITRFPRRAQAVANFATSFMGLVLFALFAWRGLISAIASHESGRLVYVINVPLAPLQLLVPVGAIVVCLVFITQMIQLYPRMKRRN